MDITTEQNFMGSEKIGKILAKIAPPVMLAQLIQALYGIIDSYFVGRFDSEALTALAVIFPVQWLISGFAIGTGVGVNTYMARQYAYQKTDEANHTAGAGAVLAIITWALFTMVAVLAMEPFVQSSVTSLQATNYAVTYGRIVCIGGLAAFLEANWTKVHQSRGNMRLPMIAQIVGALVNVILDPIFIFGWGFVPQMGVAGAAYATVIGQIAAAMITVRGAWCKPPVMKEITGYVKKIYFFGYSSILMQSLYPVYIVILNMILADFSDAAVTVLGLYYKVQSFFFIPLLGLQTCIVPVLSYNFAGASYERCRKTMTTSFLISAVFMIVGIVCFVFFPDKVIGLFTQDAAVLGIGQVAFPIIGCGFIGAVFSLITPVFFQAIGKGMICVLLSLTRQIFCLVPLFWIFSRIGLNYAWLAFPVSETIAGSIGYFLYYKQIKQWQK